MNYFTFILIKHFRCLDEWDVFLDAVNRKEISKELLNFSLNNKDRQFIFISPQVKHLKQLGILQSLPPFTWGSCDARRELVPAANSAYATRQSARFFKHKHLDLWNGFVSVLILGFLTPPPALLCLHTQFQLFNFNKLIFIFYYFRVRLQGFSEKKCVQAFQSTKINFFAVKSTSGV